MTRMTRDKMLMAMAMVASQRGTCNRLSVGAVIAHQNRVVSIGYNGAPSGKPHCADDCGPSKPCLNTVHAEENAISWARTFGTDLQGSTMYVSHSPCVNCAKLIWLAGITRLVYNQEYRSTDGLQYLIDHNIEVVECPVSIAISVDSASSHTIQE